MQHFLVGLTRFQKEDITICASTDLTEQVWHLPTKSWPWYSNLIAATNQSPGGHTSLNKLAVPVMLCCLLPVQPGQCAWMCMFCNAL